MTHNLVLEDECLTRHNETVRLLSEFTKMLICCVLYISPRQILSRNSWLKPIFYIKYLILFNNPKVIFKSQGKKITSKFKTAKPVPTGMVRAGMLTYLLGQSQKEVQGEHVVLYPHLPWEATGPCSCKKGYPPAQARVKKRQGKACQKHKIRVICL